MGLHTILLLWLNPYIAPGPQWACRIKRKSWLEPDDLDHRFERALTVRIQQTQGRRI